MDGLVTVVFIWKYKYQMIMEGRGEAMADF